MEKKLEQKERIRKKFLQVRKNLDPAERRAKSKRILEHILDWEIYRRADTIHCFMTIKENGEVETAELVRQMESDGKRIVLPKSKPESKKLEHYVFEGEDQLEVNRLGIPEPVGGQRISPTQLDLVFVPMVAADRKKNRLGYGLGYYDRFLAKIDAVKAGLLFECCLSDAILPVEEHDVTLDYLITEEGVFWDVEI